MPHDIGVTLCREIYKIQHDKIEEMKISFCLNEKLGKAVKTTTRDLQHVRCIIFSRARSWHKPAAFSFSVLYIGA